MKDYGNYLGQYFSAASVVLHDGQAYVALQANDEYMDKVHARNYGGEAGERLRGTLAQWTDKDGDLEKLMRKHGRNMIINQGDMVMVNADALQALGFKTRGDLPVTDISGYRHMDITEAGQRQTLESAAQKIGAEVDFDLLIG